MQAYQVYQWQTCVRSLKVYAPYWVVNRQDNDLFIGNEMRTQRVPKTSRCILSQDLVPKKLARIGCITKIAELSPSFRVDAVGSTTQVCIA
jgi:hypothetical protein